MSVVAIVGRPNVGKSTLFNRLVGRRVAIVQDQPGVTRDRHYADAELDGRRLTLVDTGGLEPDSEDSMLALMAGQAEVAVREADLILFVVDVHEGLLPVDRDIAEFLRKRAKDVFLVANKTDGYKWEASAGEFYQLGFDQVFPVSAEHGRGVSELADAISERVGEVREEEALPDDTVRVAVLGRPNVGKSSFVNRILGSDRLLVSPMAGTTRDAIDTRVELDGRRFLLIDTAGIRRKSRVEKGVEQWSVMKAIRAIDRAHVCVILIDASEGITDQDIRILDLIQRGGRGAVLGLNKWDLVEKDGKTFDQIVKNLEYQLGPHRHVPIVSISALTGKRVQKVFEEVLAVREACLQRISTSKLNVFLEETVKELAPPVVGRKRTRIYYATQVSVDPPSFAFFSSYPEGIPENYIRYLMNKLRESFGFAGVPVRLFIRKRTRKGEEEA